MTHPHTGIHILQFIGQSRLVTQSQRSEKSQLFPLQARSMIQLHQLPPQPQGPHPPVRPQGQSAIRPLPASRPHPLSRRNKSLAGNAFHGQIFHIIELFRIPAVHRLPHPAFAPHLIPHPQSGGQRIPRKRKPHPPPLARHAVPASHQHGLRTNGTRGRLRCPRQNHMIHPLPFRPYVSLHFAPCPERTPRAKKEKQKASPKAETRMEVQPQSIPRTPERKDSRT